MEVGVGVGVTVAVWVGLLVGVRVGLGVLVIVGVLVGVPVEVAVGRGKGTVGLSLPTLQDCRNNSIPSPLNIKQMKMFFFNLGTPL